MNAYVDANPDLEVAWMSYKAFVYKRPNNAPGKKEAEENLETYKADSNNELDLQDMVSAEKTAIMICKIAFVTDKKWTELPIKESLTKLGATNISVYIGKSGSKYKSKVKI